MPAKILTGGCLREALSFLFGSGAGPPAERGCPYLRRTIPLLANSAAWSVHA